MTYLGAGIDRVTSVAVMQPGSEHARGHDLTWPASRRVMMDNDGPPSQGHEAEGEECARNNNYQRGYARMLRPSAAAPTTLQSTSQATTTIGAGASGRGRHYDIISCSWCRCNDEKK